MDHSLALAVLTWMGGALALVQAEDRVETLLRQMTQEEKLGLVHGAAEPAATSQGQAGYWSGVPRLGIPALRLTDGPPGILTREASTGMTATMGLAATFSRDDARANGMVIGEDARALGEDVVLEPYINIHRDQTWERAYNTFGEDPFLSGEIASAEIRGIQQQGVMAQAKHFIAYDGGDDVVVDEQTLHEIYAAPFAAVVEAGVASIMCSYNRVNGEYSCGNAATLQRLLRQELHFEGFVTSDWGAVHDTLYINRGLDLEMPGYRLGDNFLAYLDARSSRSPLDSVAQLPVAPALDDALPEEPPRTEEQPPPSLPPPAIGLRAALDRGEVPGSTVDAAARRILGQLQRFGYLDHPPNHAIVPERTLEHAPILQKTAEDAAVLLKNDHALPLKPEDLENLALIGPGAGQLMAIGASGEKALGSLDRQVSPLELLRKVGHVHFAAADDMTSEAMPLRALSDRDSSASSRGATADSAGAGAGRPAAVLEHTVQRGTALPPGTEHRWSGEFSVVRGGDYDLNLQLLGAIGSLSIDGRRVAATDELGLHGGVLQPSEDNVLPTVDGLDNLRRRVHLSPGVHSVGIELHGDSSGRPVQVRLAWATPAQRRTRYQEAIETARRARTAVVFAWSRGRPDFALPGDQDALIRDVAAVNSNTVVVLNASEPLALPWLPRVKAVLLMWYPGDEGGPATVSLLLGRVSPGGRLPFTWPVKLEDNVANDPAHPERRSNRAGGLTRYSEGLFVGYRWFDQQQRAPLFPFGFGLSYSRFDYSDLSARRTADGARVRFKLTNRGSVASDEVPQVYVSAPRSRPAGVQFAERALAGFERVRLGAGESRVMEVHVPARQLQYWSTTEHRWIDAPDRTVYVGASSRDLRLRASLQGF
ncbi:MAG TPA: glycoside hydrolase family 3 C-terminal domain-containing protein [Steroidobacteraceae bacterium]|nr:glycoside hydrolase family 3 C-terminal domain-containing protein [Steroidobacteraceae bacterium]